MNEPTHTPIDVGIPTESEWRCIEAYCSDDETTIILTKRGRHRAILGEQYVVAGLTDVKALVERAMAKEKETP